MSSTSNDTTCPACICLGGDDSPLSYAGNISGILTFAVALLASLLVTSRLFVQAREDMQEAQRMMFVNQQKMDHLGTRFRKLMDGPTEDRVRPSAGTREWMEGTLHKMRITWEQLNGTLRPLQSENDMNVTLLQRFKFIYDTKEKLDGYFAELNRYHEELREAFAKFETEAMIDNIIPDASTLELLHDDGIEEKEVTNGQDGSARDDTLLQLRNIQTMLGQVLYRLELLEGSRHDASLRRPARPDFQSQPRVGRTL